MNLFQAGDFVLASGKKSRFKIECDALSEDDWKGLAEMAMTFLPPFSEVMGVPRGGIPFANVLRNYSVPAAIIAEPTLLIVEDVFTTGGSINRFRSLVLGQRKDLKESNIIGLCAFARQKPFEWVMPLFQMSQPRKS